ncbi:MAG: glutamyl-tRNA reductase [Bdellovibrionales bacterium]|nr:glutamyl-tRNA reductase [Bdellovibrionales bacterium]
MVGLIGVNHKTLGVSAREQLAQKYDGSPEALVRLSGYLGFGSFVVISTCNRFEVVFDASVAPEQLCSALQSALGTIIPESAFYFSTGEAACRHFYQVVSGLDSMVLGEPQICGQVKAAYQLASESLSPTKYLHKLFQSGFRVAKTVRTHTDIAREGVSMSYVAIKLAEKIFGNLKQSSVLLLGSGEIAELCALHLKSRGVTKIVIANRTLAHAQALCERFGGVAVGIDDVARLLPDVDIVIGSLRIDRPIFEIKTLRNTRRERPLFLIDLGVPRNFQAGIDELENIYLYNVDDLGKIVSSNIHLREDAAKDADVIIEYAVHRFMHWSHKVSIQPALLDFRRRIFEICSDEMTGRKSQLQVEQIAYRISKRLAHEMQDSFMESYQSGEDAFEQLFEIDPLRLVTSKEK